MPLLSRQLIHGSKYFALARDGFHASVQARQGVLGLLRQIRFVNPKKLVPTQGLPTEIVFREGRPPKR